jgi:hypothetical protein
MNKAILIFTGHNNRAVVALCRALSSINVAFHLVASSETDPIFKTSWASFVSLTRSDRQVDLALFDSVRRSVDNNQELLYCPTTEFINVFVLENRNELENLGFTVILPSTDIYGQLTNKSQSIHLIKNISDLKSPQHISWQVAKAPCIFKPNSNLQDGEVLYPIMCLIQSKVEETKQRLDPKQWFVQKYIQGQSYYLCGYLSRNGGVRYYWQTNLMQQQNGKSIVLARTGANLDIDENQFFDGLANMGYFGPCMMEIIEEADGQLNFIEINPRFWGPLQLGVDACPEMIGLYASDLGFSSIRDLPPQKKNDTTHWYAWANGAQTHKCHVYPTADLLSDIERQKLLNKHDVYSRNDTRSIQGHI